jgi:hypothetical protein
VPITTNPTTTTTTYPTYVHEVPRTFEVTFEVPRPSDGKVIALPVIVVAIRPEAHNKAASILRSRLGLPASYTLMGKLRQLHGPIGAEAVATNPKVVPPLNKRRQTSKV